MITIFKREVRSYFNSMMGSVCIFAFLMITGMYFASTNLYMGEPSFANALLKSQFVLIVVIPILTMKSMADEKSRKTDQLLKTYPTSTDEVILGKYFAVAFILGVPILICCFYPIILKAAAGSSGAVMWKADYCAIAVFYVLGLLYCSVGIFVSALTSSQMISAMLTFGLLLMLSLWDSLGSLMPGQACANLMIVVVLFTVICSLIDHILKLRKYVALIWGMGIAAMGFVFVIHSQVYTNLVANIMRAVSLNAVFNSVVVYKQFDVGGMFLYLSMIVLFLTLTIQITDMHR